MYLVTTRGEVDAVEVETQIAGEHFRGHGFAGAARPRQQQR